jgi:hypothetical protein
MLDWDALTPLVEEYINLAKNALKGEPVEVAGTNKLWERNMTKQ